MIKLQPLEIAIGGHQQASAGRQAIYVAGRLSMRSCLESGLSELKCYHGKHSWHFDSPHNYHDIVLSFDSGSIYPG